jgi:uncharacterized protein YgiM (DUF1202 family)
MRLRGFRACVWPWTMALAAAGLWLMLPVAVPAQTGSESKGELGLPSTTIAPAEGETPQAPPPVTTHHRTPAPAIHHPHVSSAMTAPVKSVPVEPAQAKVLLKQDTWIYAQPSNKSAHVEKGEKGKFVMVTGSTHYFLRVKLKNGQDGYVMADAVEIAAPADKLFTLTHDAPVLNAPNRWGKKMSQVHQGHAVHVVGVALNYMKIRMHSGMEGYIPSSALE